MKGKRKMTKALLGGGFILLLIFTLVGQVAANTCVQPPSGLISWWDGDAVSGTTALDIKGGNDGTMLNGVQIVSGKVGNAFSFPGKVFVRIQLPFDSGDVFTNQFTVDAWARPQKITTFRHCQAILENDDILNPPTAARPNTRGMFFGFCSGIPSGSNPFEVVGFFHNTDTAVPGFVVSANTSPNPTAFRHYALTYDGSSLRVYENGVLKASTSATGNLNDNNTKFRIAGHTEDFNVNRFYKGEIDEVEIYNRALTAAEIEAIFLAGSAGKCKAPVLDHFKCYEAEGDDVNATVTLEDQFGVEPVVRVDEPELFCNPVDKNGEGIADPTAHLTAYEIEGDDEEVERVVVVTNQFGQEQTLTVEEPELLFVPSEKGGVPSALNLDHFKCYEAEGAPVNITVNLEDQFGVEPQVLVKEPELFCNPVAKNATFPDDLVNPEAHLTCYEIEGAGEETERDVRVANQFGDQSLEVKEPQFLCVPSEKVDVQVIE